MTGNRLDLLLIKPGSQKKIYGKLGEKSLTGIEPPLWAGLMATYVRQRGYSVRIIDAEAEQLAPAEVVDRVAEADPMLAAIVVSGTNPSASTMNMVGTRAILEEIAARRLAAKTLVAGLHPSALPARTMAEEQTDFLCEGEGFSTLAELLAALKASPETGTFAIPGLWYRQDGQVIANPRAPLIEDLDRDLPCVSWDLLPMDKYRAHNWHCFQEPGQAREPYAVIYTSLGCPFNCHFCCINALFGGPGIRYRSPEKVIEELDVLVGTYGVKNIKIIDEMFVFKQSHVLGICEGIKQRGFDLNIWAYARINTVNDRLLRALREAGVKWLAYGIESGSDRVLKSVNKKITVEKTKAVVKRTKEFGIHVIGNFMVGLPEDDRQSIQETMDLATELNCEFMNLYGAIAYPGSALYEQAVQEGWPLPETWPGYSPYAYEHVPLPTNYLTGPEVLRFRDEAYVAYYRNPCYQELVRETFGEEVLAYVRQHLTTQLERKCLDTPPTREAS